MKNKILLPKFYLLSLLLVFLFAADLSAQGNVGIGTTSPDESAILHVDSENQGVLFPRLTQSQQDQIPAAAANGLMIFNTETQKLMFNDQTQAGAINWQPIGLWNRDAGNNDIYYNGSGALKDVLNLSATTPSNLAGESLGEIQFSTNGGGSGVTASIEGYNDTGAINNAGLRFSTSYDWAGKLERMRIDREGRIGIGATNPLTRLSISPYSTEAKITFWDNGSSTTHYGFGVSSGQLNYHVPSTASNHVFYRGGKNGNGTELMRIQGDGRVEIISGNDAGPGQGTGVLEIANSLRIDGNEIITNSGTPLHLQSDNGGDLHVDGGTLFVDASENRIGIGTTSPEAPLHVASSTSHIYCCDCPYNPVGVLVGHSTIRTTLACAGNANQRTKSIYAEGDIISNSGIFSISDIRLKKNIHVSATSADLQSLKNIEIVNYKMIDTISDNRVYKKVIAQQVEEVYPIAVEKDNENTSIPSVFQIASSIEKIGVNEYQLSVSNNHGLLLNDQVDLRCYPGNTKLTVTVSKILSSDVFLVKSTAELDTMQSVFIYGKKVADLLTVDYDAIAMLNVSATQELAKQMEELKIQNQMQAERISDLEKQLGALDNLKASVEKLQGLLLPNGNDVSPKVSMSKK